MTLKQIFIASDDLDITIDEIIIQIEQYQDDIINNNIKKIIYKASQEEIITIIGSISIFNKIKIHDNIQYDIIFNKGLIETPINNILYVVFKPENNQILDFVFRDLELIKTQR